MKYSDDRFQELLRSWNRHFDARHRHASIAELADARFRLDAARDALR